MPFFLQWATFSGMMELTVIDLKSLVPIPNLNAISWRIVFGVLFQISYLCLFNVNKPGLDFRIPGHLLFIFINSCSSGSPTVIKIYKKNPYANASLREMCFILVLSIPSNTSTSSTNVIFTFFDYRTTERQMHLSHWLNYSLTPGLQDCWSTHLTNFILIIHCLWDCMNIVLAVITVLFGDYGTMGVVALCLLKLVGNSELAHKPA